MNPGLKKVFVFMIKLAFACFFMFFMLEFGLAFLCSRGKLDIQKPSYQIGNVTSRFWVDMNSDFGVWHGPNSSYRHTTADYSVSYHANSWGMRDRARMLESGGKKRVLVLGDSFAEGYGVEDGKRFSDVLENTTGLEHLNFGTAGSFGPTQYYLLYKTLAKKFEHDAVMVCILPFNDFLDDDYEYGKTAHASRYRPYFAGQSPDYKLIYTMKELPSEKGKLTEQLLREFTYTGNLIKHMKGLARHRATAVSASYAGYYDYTREQWQRLCYVLGLIHRDAEGKEVIILTIPSVEDFARMQKGETSKLPGELAAYCKAAGMTYVDLLPGIQAAEKGSRACYYQTDPHWNAYGSKVAADFILKNVDWYKGKTASSK